MPHRSTSGRGRSRRCRPWLYGREATASSRPPAPAAAPAKATGRSRWIAATWASESAPAPILKSSRRSTPSQVSEPFPPARPLIWSRPRGDFMRYILAPEWSHLGLATAAAFVLGYLLCWGMDKLFLKRLVDDRIAGIAMGCGLAFVLIMAAATVGLTWFVRSQPYIAGRPIVLPPFPYAVSLIFALAVLGVIRTIRYGR